jgi:LacI family transcriptional regulator
VRLIDVALKAGVHHSTVSAVLNNSQSCYASDSTRQRIHDAAASLNYRPSALARGLVGQRTATLGVITTGYDLELVLRMIYGFEESARAADQFVLVASSVNRPELEDRAIQQLVDRAVDGIASWPCHRAGGHAELHRLIERRFPLVIFGENTEEVFDADHVYDDALEAGRIQAQHLIDCGRRKVWLLRSVERCQVNDRKVEGFEQLTEMIGENVVGDSVTLHIWRDGESFTQPIKLGEWD